MKTIKAISRQAVFCILLTYGGVCGGFEMTQYLTSKPSPVDGSVDTIARLAWLEVPQIHRLTRLEITYPSRLQSSDSTFLYLSGGTICNCSWEKRYHVWRGQVSPGDTLRCTLSFAPQVAGPYGVGARIVHDSSPIAYRGIPFGFALDEHGTPLDSFDSRKRYASLGLLPDAQGDSIVFIWWCTEHPAAHRVGPPPFVLRATIHPPFRSGDTSTISVVCIPLWDFTQGVSYTIQYSQHFRLILSDSSDWNVASRGDTLKLQFKCVAVQHGIGMISINFLGLVEPTPNSHLLVEQSGSGVDHLRMYFVIDDNGTLIAYNQDSPPLWQSHRQDDQLSPRADAYRVEEIEALSVDSIISTELYSDSAKTRREIIRQRLKSIE